MESAGFGRRNTRFGTTDVTSVPLTRDNIGSLLFCHIFLVIVPIESVAKVFEYGLKWICFLPNTLADVYENMSILATVGL